MSEQLTIGEVAERSGVCVGASLLRGQGADQLRAERAGSGHRRYQRPVLRRIAFIVFAQRVGLTLEEIGTELAKLLPDRAPTRRATGRGCRAAEPRIDERIAELERLKVGLTSASAAADVARPLPVRQPG